MADAEEKTKKKEKKKKRSFPSQVGSAEKQTEEVAAARGGRAITSQSCWEMGAQDGEAYMLFSSVDQDNEELEARHFRCVLCARFRGKETVVKATNGQSNLWAHLASAHGLEKKKKNEAPATKKQVKGQSSIDSYGRISDMDARRAAVKYIIRRAEPFSLVESDAFLEYTQVVSKRQNLKLVTRNTVKEDILAMANVCSQRLMKFITVEVPASLSVEKLRIHLTADGKKVKHKPMYDILVSFWGGKKCITFPLEVSPIAGKSEEDRAAWVKRALQKKKIPLEWVISFTGDEGEAGIVRFLGDWITFIPDPPHRFSTVAKHGLRNSGLVKKKGDDKPLFLDKTQEMALYVTNRYEVYAYYDQKASEVAFFVGGRKARVLQTLSSTRFLAAFFVGATFVQNEALLLDLIRHAAAQEKDVWKKLPLDEDDVKRMIPIWKDVCLVMQELNSVSERLSGSVYCTVAEILPAVVLTKARVYTMLHLRDSPFVTSEGRRFAEELYKAFGVKFEEDFNNKLLCAACIFNPLVRDFNPAWLLPTLMEARRTMTKEGKERFLTLSQRQSVWSVLHKKLGEKMVLNTIEYLYELTDGDLQLELDLNPDLRRAKEPLPQREATEGSREWLKMTLLGKAVLNYVTHDRYEMVGVTDDMDLYAFWQNCTTWKSLKPFALDILCAFGSSVDSERLWKSTGMDHSKARAALGLEVGATQTWLREMDKLSRRHDLGLLFGIDFLWKD